MEEAKLTISFFLFLFLRQAKYWNFTEEFPKATVDCLQNQ